jgi:hypothetical protein
MDAFRRHPRHSNSELWGVHWADRCLETFVQTGLYEIRPPWSPRVDLSGVNGLLTITA